MLKVKDAKAHVEARNNITKTWQVLLSKAIVPDRNKPLTLEILEDPTHPVVGVLNWCYTAENFVFKVLNYSSRVKDQKKISSMGPYAAALS